MPNGRTRRVLTVFLASPGDLGDERRLAREEVAEINRTLAREVDWEVELLGWEDTLPGGRRPQELINEDVDACDLFIGMLWRRWGQSTGKYSSGFEEEFERVQRRREKNGEPEIWLFFKAVDPDQKADAGEQLQRVLEFRAMREREKDCLFRDFGGTDQFRGILRESLLRYTLRLAIRDIRSTVQPEESNPPTDLSDRSADATQVASSASDRELKACMSAASEAIQRVTSPWPAYSRALTSEQITRLYLFAASAVSWTHTAEVLGSHDQNLAYKVGREFQLVSDELNLLFRGLLSDDLDLLPGWVWFRDFSADGLQYFATNDREASVRRGALRLLADAAIPFDQASERTQFFQRTFQDNDEGTARESLRYFAAVGTRDDLPLLDFVADARYRSDVQFAVLSVRIRDRDAQGVVDSLFSMDSPPKEAIQLLRDRSEVIDSERLLTLIKHPDSELRLSAARELARRNELTAETSRALLSDKSAELRGEALRSLVALGVPIGIEDVRQTFKDTLFASLYIQEVLVRLFETKPTEQLESLINWYSIDSDKAYEALARKEPSRLVSVREDLRTDFADVKQRATEGIRKQYGEAGVEVVLRDFDQKLNDYIRDSHRKAAIRVLSDLGETEDRPLMLELLSGNHSEMRELALHFLERQGRSEDATALADCAIRESDAALASKAAVLAIRLLPTAQTVRRFLESGGSSALATLQVLESRADLLSSQEAEALLKHENQRIRQAAVAILTRRCDRDQLEDILRRYVSQDSYFYNVVCWLDRALYAPEFLSGMLRAKLMDYVAKS